MRPSWKTAKLYGGELDGAAFVLEFDPPPEVLFVLPLCPRCKCYHHAPADKVDGQVPGGVTYVLKRIDHEASVAHYKHGDLNEDGPDGIVEEVDRGRELELV